MIRSELANRSSFGAVVDHPLVVPIDDLVDCVNTYLDRNPTEYQKIPFMDMTFLQYIHYCATTYKAPSKNVPRECLDEALKYVGVYLLVTICFDNCGNNNTKFDVFTLIRFLEYFNQSAERYGVRLELDFFFEGFLSAHAYGGQTNYYPKFRANDDGAGGYFCPYTTIVGDWTEEAILESYASHPNVVFDFLPVRDNIDTSVIRHQFVDIVHDKSTLMPFTQPQARLKKIKLEECPMGTQALPYNFVLRALNGFMGVFDLHGTLTELLHMLSAIEYVSFKTYLGDRKCLCYLNDSPTGLDGNLALYQRDMIYKFSPLTQYQGSYFLVLLSVANWPPFTGPYGDLFTTSLKYGLLRVAIGGVLAIKFSYEDFGIHFPCPPKGYVVPSHSRCWTIDDIIAGRAPLFEVFGFFRSWFVYTPVGPFDASIVLVLKGFDPSYCGAISHDHLKGRLSCALADSNYQRRRIKGMSYNGKYIYWETTYDDTPAFKLLGRAFRTAMSHSFREIHYPISDIVDDLHQVNVAYTKCLKQSANHVVTVTSYKAEYLVRAPLLVKYINFDYDNYRSFYVFKWIYENCQIEDISSVVQYVANYLGYHGVFSYSLATDGHCWAAVDCDFQCPMLLTKLGDTKCYPKRRDAKYMASRECLYQMTGVNFILSSDPESVLPCKPLKRSDETSIVL